MRPALTTNLDPLLRARSANAPSLTSRRGLRFRTTWLNSRRWPLTCALGRVCPHYRLAQLRRRVSAAAAHAALPRGAPGDHGPVHGGDVARPQQLRPATGAAVVVRRQGFEPRTR